MRSGDLAVGRWGARFLGRRFPCATGRGGIGVKTGEGDGVTPMGSHRIEAVFWRMERIWNPYGLRMASFPVNFRPIGLRDGWSDDPADPAYNDLVQRPHRFSHEAMRRADPMYDIVLVTDWNWPDAAPGRGSAIFLHQWRRPGFPTAGCVAFSREDLCWIAARVQPGARLIVPGGMAW